MNAVKIYTLSNPLTNEVKYVGKTELSLEKRLYYHIWDLKRSKNMHKINWFNFLSKENLKPHIELIDEVPYDEWKFWEQFWISQFKAWGFKLINLTEGGEGYTSAQLKYLWTTKEYRDYHTARVQGSKAPFYGKKHTDEVKAILREKCPHKGIEHPNYGKKQTEEFKIKNRLNQPTLKKIIRKDLNGTTIDIWIGFKYMCKILSLDEGAVIRVLKGKVKTHKKYKFEYFK